MALAVSGNAWISWSERGTGEPLLLIMGLGGSGRAWWRLLPHLTPHNRVIVLDNRGTGDSDRIRGRLTMDDMVADVVAVLDAAEVGQAHVLGVSMGGMIAQRLALDHRPRVRSLLLGCTTAGGTLGRRHPPWRLLGASALRPVLGPARTFGLVAPALYAPATRRERPERIAADMRVRGAEATPTATIIAQMVAVAAHDTRARLTELAGLPVTVLHGEEDALVDVEEGRALAAAIPGARLVTIPRCGHMLTTDAEERATGAVLEHLAAYAGAARAA